MLKFKARSNFMIEVVDIVVIDQVQVRHCAELGKTKSPSDTYFIIPSQELLKTCLDALES